MYQYVVRSKNKEAFAVILLNDDPDNVHPSDGAGGGFGWG